MSLTRHWETAGVQESIYHYTILIQTRGDAKCYFPLFTHLSDSDEVVHTAQIQFSENMGISEMFQGWQHQTWDIFYCDLIQLSINAWMKSACFFFHLEESRRCWRCGRRSNVALLKCFFNLFSHGFVFNWWQGIDCACCELDDIVIGSVRRQTTCLSFVEDFVEFMVYLWNFHDSGYLRAFNWGWHHKKGWECAFMENQKLWHILLSG